MTLRLRTFTAVLAAALLAVSIMSFGRARAEESPETLVMGTIRPPVAGQVVGVAVGGVVCTSVNLPGNGITAADGSYALVVHNCGRGRATLMLNGTATSTQFDLVPGVPSTGINVGVTTNPSTGTNTTGTVMFQLRVAGLSRDP